MFIRLTGLQAFERKQEAIKLIIEVSGGVVKPSMPNRPPIGSSRPWSSTMTTRALDRISRSIFRKLVETPIQSVLVYQGEVRAEQIAHRTLFVPLPVQPPLAAGVDQAVGDQRLQHVQPPCPLPPAG